MIASGTVLQGQYRIEAEIRRGRFDVVYRAQDLRSHRLVSVKDVLDPLADAAQQSRAVAQLRDEFRTLSTLVHPGLPEVHALVEEGSSCYLVMEFLKGQTLDTLVEEKGGPLDVAQVLPWLAEMLDVLGFLHAQTPPIIYRDLQPSTVLVTTEGHVKLCDFSIAKLMGPEKMRTRFRALGTPDYSPPESFGVTRSQPQSDLYALGATLFFLLSGSAPPTSASRALQQSPLPDLPATVPASLASTILKMMEMKPQERPADVDAARALLAGPDAELPGPALAVPAPTGKPDATLQQADDVMKPSGKWDVEESPAPRSIPWALYGASFLLVLWLAWVVLSRG